MVAAIQHHFWHFFQEIRTLTVNKHTTLVEIGLTKMWNEEINEAFLASQQNLADCQTRRADRTVVLSQSLDCLCDHHYKYGHSKRR